MELRIWKYGIDDQFIGSWLAGQAKAHNLAPKTEDWFHWKFEHSPYGKAILACAFDGDAVAGCVAYGIGRMKYNGEVHKCALSYETFVRHDYQGHGLFKRLIKLAEEEAIIEDVHFLYNYPNSNSLPGFKHMGFVQRNDLQRFVIKICKFSHVSAHIKDLKMPFHPYASNLSEIECRDLSDIIIDHAADDVVLPFWTNDYLKWRFFTFPNREYHVINTPDYFAISMIGNRGRLKDAHLLYAVSKHEDVNISRYASKIIKGLRSEVSPDVITYSSTVDDGFLRKVPGFFKVPSHSNYCYKILSPAIRITHLKTILPSINAHTY